MKKILVKFSVVGGLLLLLSSTKLIKSAAVPSTPVELTEAAPFPPDDGTGCHSFDIVPAGGVYSGTIRGKDRHTRHFQIKKLQGNFVAALVITRRGGTRQVVIQHDADAASISAKALPAMRSILQDGRYGTVVRQNFLIALPKNADHATILAPWRELTDMMIVKPYASEAATKLALEHTVPAFQIRFNGYGAQWMGWEAIDGGAACYGRCRL